MITGTFYELDRPGVPATLLEGENILAYYYPSQNEVVSERGVQIFKAKVIASQNDIDWTTISHPYFGFYVAN